MRRQERMKVKKKCIEREKEERSYEIGEN